MIYRYFVEGDCEKKFIDCFKVAPFNYYISGKIIIFNVLQKKLTSMYLKDLVDDTTIIFIYDTDKISDSHFAHLKYNHEFCQQFRRIKRIIHIQSINNFEDEIVYSGKFNKITYVFDSEGNKEFKRMFMHCTNLPTKLTTDNFNFSKMWTRFSVIDNFRLYIGYKDSIWIDPSKTSKDNL